MSGRRGGGGGENRRKAKSDQSALLFAGRRLSLMSREKLLKTRGGRRARGQDPVIW